MKDEIKEILESSRKIIKSNRENGFDRIIMLGDDIDKLLDYITNLQKDRDDLDDHNRYLHTELTNLQEENERLKAQNTRYEIKMNSLIQENNVLKENAEHNDKVVDKAKWNEMIYKSRIDKAIEYMNNYIELEDAPINERIKIEFKEVIKLLNGEYEE